MNLNTRNIFVKGSLLPTEFPEHNANQSYQELGIMITQYPAHSEDNRLKNQSTGIYAFHGIIIEQEVYKHASYPYAR